MQEFIYFFENISSLQRSLILVGGITFFWSIESLIPLFKFNYSKLKHALPNLFFTLTTVLKAERKPKTRNTDNNLALQKSPLSTKQGRRSETRRSTTTKQDLKHNTSAQHHKKESNWRQIKAQYHRPED
jgi:hypothetical protein